MKLRHLLPALALAAAAAAPAQALEIDLGDAGNYSGFFLEDVTGISSVGGRLALGGNLSVTNASIGALGPNLPQTPSLVVKGNVTAYAAGAIWSGASQGFGQYMGTLGTGVAGGLDLRKVTSVPVDFDSERVYLGTMSEQLQHLAATGTVTASGGALALNGTKAALEVFAMTAAQAASGLRVLPSNIATGATVVINVGSDSTQHLSFTVDTTALQNWPGHVLLNAYDAQLVQFGSTAVRGSVLALKACICNSTATIQGNVVARKWNSTAAIGYVPFVPKP